MNARGTVTPIKSTEFQVVFVYYFQYNYISTAHNYLDLQNYYKFREIIFLILTLNHNNPQKELSRIMAGQKAVIKLEVNGKRPASIAKKMGVGMLKTILPFEFVSECFNHTAPQNKSKAMQIAVGFHGVNSAGLQGEGKDELVVKGVFDPVELVALLRERVGGATITSVGPEEEKKKEEPKKEEPKKDDKKPPENAAVVYPWHSHQPLVLCEIPEYTPRCFPF
nr:heavy metal-associated isoprenylated plant protein 47-like [Ipomoea trifida]